MRKLDKWKTPGTTEELRFWRLQKALDADLQDTEWAGKFRKYTTIEVAEGFTKEFEAPKKRKRRAPNPTETTEAD